MSNSETGASGQVTPNPDATTPPPSSTAPATTSPHQ
jgi:hypothetical protein